MAKKIHIERIGNSTVVKQWDDNNPTKITAKNYNLPHDIDLIDGQFTVSLNGKPVLTFLFSQVDNPGDAETAEEYMELMASSFFFSRVEGGSGSGEAIEVEGNPFTWVKNPVNGTKTILKGDIAVNGWYNPTTFVKLMIYNSGDPTLFSSWTILDQIEDVVF